MSGANQAGDGFSRWWANWAGYDGEANWADDELTMMGWRAGEEVTRWWQMNSRSIVVEILKERGREREAIWLKRMRMRMRSHDRTMIVGVQLNGIKAHILSAML